MNFEGKSGGLEVRVVSLEAGMMDLGFGLR